MAPVAKPHEVSEIIVEGVEVHMMAVQAFRGTTATTLIFHRRLSQDAIGLLPRMEFLTILFVCMIPLVKLLQQAIPVLLSPQTSCSFPFPGMILTQGFPASFGIFSSVAPIAFKDLLMVTIGPIFETARSRAKLSPGLRPAVGKGLATDKTDSFLELLTLVHDGSLC